MSASGSVGGGGSGSGSGSGKICGRSVTRLPGLTAGRIAKERIPVDVEAQSGKASGPNAQKFKSYLGLLARRHISITISSWEEVPEAEKNMLWQDIQVFINFHIYSTLYTLIYVFNIYFKFDSKLLTSQTLKG